MSSITAPAMGMSRPAGLGSSARAQRREAGAGRSAASLRLTARGRAVLLALLAIPLAIGIAVLSIGGGTATATIEDGASLEYVLVQPGQTLWGLAGELAPASDPREVIDELIRFNQLGSADLAAGQQLAIPPKYVG